MNTPNRKDDGHNTAYAGEAEKTLRIIAGLPAPEGLEDRVKAALEVAPRSGRILHWPSAARPGRRWMQNTWARSAAAAAIVFVVAGGGWGVYSRVQPTQTSKVIVMPRVAAPGGFSNSGAMRTPQTLNGHVLKHPLAPTPKQIPAGDKSVAQRRDRNKSLSTPRAARQEKPLGK